VRSRECSERPVDARERCIERRVVGVAEETVQLAVTGRADDQAQVVHSHERVAAALEFGDDLKDLRAIRLLADGSNSRSVALMSLIPASLIPRTCWCTGTRRPLRCSISRFAGIVSSVRVGGAPPRTAIAQANSASASASVIGSGTYPDRSRRPSVCTSRSATISLVKPSEESTKLRHILVLTSDPNSQLCRRDSSRVRCRPPASTMSLLATTGPDLARSPMR
jgi:hypothetical protein